MLFRKYRRCAINELAALRECVQMTPMWVRSRHRDERHVRACSCVVATMVMVNFTSGLLVGY